MVAKFYFKDDRIRSKEVSFMTQQKLQVETSTEQPPTVEMSTEGTTVEMTTIQMTTQGEMIFDLSVENVTDSSASILMTTSNDVRAVDVIFASSVLPQPIRQRLTMFKKVNVFRFTSLPSGE